MSYSPTFFVFAPTSRETTTSVYLLLRTRRRRAVVVDGDPSQTAAPPQLGVLLTNAKKVTVSVLYWYEKLSSLLTEIFKLIPKGIKTFLFFFHLFSRPWAGGGSPVLWWPEMCPGWTGQPTTDRVLAMPRRLCWVRPYLVESTTSRPICEVKQLQA